jgi:hypothetical protein
MKYQLIKFTQGETNCEHCGTSIKNIYTILDTEKGIELNVGSECVQKLLQVETLPKEYKQLEKEYKNRKFNESIVNMIVSVRPSFMNSNLYTSLVNGTVKATDKSVLISFVKNQWYTATQEKDNNRYVLMPNYELKLSERAGDFRQKTDEEYKLSVEEIKKSSTTYFYSDFATTKECKKFIDELIKYIESNFPIWGWIVKYLVTR